PASCYKTVSINLTGTVVFMVANFPAKVRNLLPRKGRYWARVSVPKGLRPIIGKRELTEPLGADLTMAKRKLPGAVARMLERLNAAREELDAERKPLAPPLWPNRVLSHGNLAKAHFDAELSLDDAERAVDPMTLSDVPGEHARLF